MKTIKIIDLFNKIVNGEEVPLRIKWDGDTWKFKEQFNDYLNETEEEKEYLFYTGFDNYADAKRFLNCEVEIIEEEPEEKDNFTGWRIFQNGEVVASMYTGDIPPLRTEIRKIEVVGDDSIVDNTDGERHLLNTNRKDRNIYIKKINELIDTINELKRGN